MEDSSLRELESLAFICLRISHSLRSPLSCLATALTDASAGMPLSLEDVRDCALATQKLTEVADTVSVLAAGSLSASSSASSIGAPAVLSLAAFVRELSREASLPARVIQDDGATANASGASDSETYTLYPEYLRQAARCAILYAKDASTAALPLLKLSVRGGANTQATQELVFSVSPSRKLPVSERTPLRELMSRDHSAESVLLKHLDLISELHRAPCFVSLPGAGAVSFTLSFAARSGR